MKKTLLMATALCLSAFAAQAQSNWGYAQQYQNAPQYQAAPQYRQATPQYRQAAPQQQAPVAPCQAASADQRGAYQGAPVTLPANVVYVTEGKPAYEKYAISNPMYMLGAGHVSFDTNLAYKWSPKDKSIRENKGEYWQASETFAVGLTDRLSLKASASYFKMWENKVIAYSKNHTFSLGAQYNLVNTSVFDMHAGVDVHYWKMRGRDGDLKGDGSVTYVDPYIKMGASVGMFTPYVLVGYNTLLFSKDSFLDQGYYIQPGLYFQPVEYLGIDLNMTAAESVDSEWQLRFDIYPVQNVAIGLAGYLSSPNDDKTYEMDVTREYGFGANIKVMF